MTNKYVVTLHPTHHFTIRCPRGQAASVQGKSRWVDRVDNREREERVWNGFLLSFCRRIERI